MPDLPAVLKMDVQLSYTADATQAVMQWLQSCPGSVRFPKAPPPKPTPQAKSSAKAPAQATLPTNPTFAPASSSTVDQSEIFSKEAQVPCPRAKNCSWVLVFAGSMGAEGDEQQDPLALLEELPDGTSEVNVCLEAERPPTKMKDV
ncbi:unnamed protein product [Effrenium voratum]|nr:unnamed protein product [Effrenium voratum]